MNLFSFYEQLKSQEEVDRFVETYRDLSDQQNRTGIILNGVIVAPENPTITNLYSSLIVPMSYTCTFRTTLANRDQGIWTINNLIEKLKGRKVDIAQLNCVDENGKHFPSPFMVGTIGQNDGKPKLKNGDYIGEITSATEIPTIIDDLKNNKGVDIPSVASSFLYLYVGYSNKLRVCKYGTTQRKLTFAHPPAVTSELPYVYAEYEINELLDPEDFVQPIVASKIAVTTLQGTINFNNVQGTIESCLHTSTTTTLTLKFNINQVVENAIYTRVDADIYVKEITGTLIVDDGSYHDIIFPPDHTSFEKYKVSLSFDAVRCDEPRNLNETEYCVLSFGGNATLVSNGVKLGNDLLKIKISKDKIPASTDITYESNAYYLEPLEMPSGNSISTNPNQLVSNLFKTNSHADSITLTLQYTFIVDENIEILNQWYEYARYGTLGTSQNQVSPNLLYTINEYYCSWGNFKNKEISAKIVGDLEIENTESDTLTIGVSMQIQGDNN